MVRGVNSGLWVVVIKPCSANVRVLLNNYIWNTKLPKLDGCTDSGKPSTNHQHAKTGWQLWRYSTRPVHVTINKAQFFQQHGRVLRGNLFGYTVAHHGHELIVVNLGWQGAGTSIQFVKNRRHCCTDFLLNVIREPACFVVKQVGVSPRKVRFAQPFLVARDLCEAHQQRRYRRLCQY